MIAASRLVGRLLGLRRRWLLVSLALACAQAALLVPVGLLLRTAFDEAIPDGDTGGLVRIGAALLALSLASGALALGTRWIVLTLTKQGMVRLRMSLLARLQTLPAAWFHRRDADQLHAIVVEDSERVDVMSNALAAQVLPAAIVAAALGVALAVLDLLLFAILAATLPPMLFASWRLRPVIGRRTRAWQRAFDRFSARIRFAIRGRALIAAQVAEPIELESGRREMRELSARGRSMAWLQSLYSQLNGTLATIAAVIVLVVGGLAVGRDATTLGSLISFYALLGLLRGQLAQLLVGFPQLISGRESLTRLEAILEAEDVQPIRGTRQIDFGGEIELRSVHFGYGAEPVLRGVDLLARPGEWVAIVGPNGAGKSTIASLILGVYRPGRGSVFADGIPLEELDIHDLRRQIAIVPQSPVIFDGTVAANIAYGDPSIDSGGVREAAALAGVSEAITALRDGYETRVGEEGEQLSGGQRQGLALVRALVRRPALLILDEPTLSLDRDAAPAMLERLRELPWEPTVLLISHDSAAISLADRSYRLNHGRAFPARADERLVTSVDA